MNVNQKWLDYVAETKRVAEAKRLAHYYGNSVDLNKKLKKDVVNLKKELQSKYKKMVRMIDDGRV